MKKKILIVSRSFYPENSPRSFRTTELVKEFARKGNNVTVLTPKIDEIHIPFEKKHKITIKNLGKLKFKDIDFRSGGKITILLKRVFRRALNLLFDYPDIELLFLVKKALLKEEDYDLLISIAAPHPVHWGVARVWKKKKNIAKTWIADCGDPFMGVTTDSFKKPFYFKYVEKYWCKKADYITVPFLGAKDGYYKEFHKKIKVIPQGLNFEEIEVQPLVYKPNKILTFAYAGGLIPGARDPKKFIEYLLTTGIDFKFILYTKSVAMVTPLLAKAKNKIEIKDYIPREKLIMALSKMDFIVNFNNGVSTQLPSKLIDYYLAKRPVLSIDSFKFDKGIVAQFLHRDYKNKFIYNNPEQYKIENVAQEFLNLIE